MSRAPADWEAEFEQQPRVALTLLDETPFDVVVAALEMPEVHGAVLLEETARRRPHAVRIALSKHGERDLALKAMGMAHRCLRKGCDPNDLLASIRGAIESQRLVDNGLVRDLVGQLTAVPSLPSLYTEIQNALETPDVSVHDVARIVAKDPGMTAKILQLVNSAIFPIRHSISSIERAVPFLGIETTRTLVLSLQVFKSFDSPRLKRLRLGGLWNHSLMTGALARRIAQEETDEMELIQDAFTAGMLHDLGKLVLAACEPGRYADVIQAARKQAIPEPQAEREVLGVDHAQVGAYLAALWGLPRSIVETLGFHHRPALRGVAAFDVVLAVHVADLLEQEGRPPASGAAPNEIDLKWLETVGLDGRLDAWRELRDRIGDDE